MYSIIKEIERFFNTFAEKDNWTQWQAIRRLIKIAAFFALLAGLLSLFLH